MDPRQDIQPQHRALYDEWRTARPDDLHRVRAMIRDGLDHGDIATRAGVPREVITLAAMRVRRAGKRVARRQE